MSQVILSVCERELLFTDDRYFRSSVLFISSDDGLVKGISMSHASEATLKTDNREAAGGERKVTGRVLEGTSRLYTRIRKSDPTIALLFLFGLVLLIGLSVSLCYPAQHAHLPAKPQVEGTACILTVGMHFVCASVFELQKST